MKPGDCVPIQWENGKRVGNYLPETQQWVSSDVLPGQIIRSYAIGGRQFHMLRRGEYIHKQTSILFTIILQAGSGKIP